MLVKEGFPLTTVKFSWLKCKNCKKYDLFSDTTDFYASLCSRRSKVFSRASEVLSRASEVFSQTREVLSRTIKVLSRIHSSYSRFGAFWSSLPLRSTYQYDLVRLSPSCAIGP